MNRKDFITTSLLAGLPTTLFATNPAGKDRKLLKPFYIVPDDAPLDPGPGIAIRTKVRSSQTNMQYSCVDVAVAPKTMGPAPHVHKSLDELMYVYEGTMTIMVGDEICEVQAGGWHFRPSGIPHTFWNATDSIVRCTDMYFNQNFEDFLEEMFHQILPDLYAQKIAPQEGERLIHALNRKFGITTFDSRRQSIIEKYGLKNG